MAASEGGDDVKLECQRLRSDIRTLSCQIIFHIMAGLDPAIQSETFGCRPYAA
jgi:hypothetical protein